MEGRVLWSDRELQIRKGWRNVGPRQEELDTMEMRFVSRRSIFLGGIKIFVPGFCCLGERKKGRERKCWKYWHWNRIWSFIYKMALKAHQAHWGAVLMQIQNESRKRDQFFVFSLNSCCWWLFSFSLLSFVTVASLSLWRKWYGIFSLGFDQGEYQT